tara:strand:- start:483 stop:677 length:195 start_codon:yes stop_codon:yes gene_type:complete
LSQLFFVEDAPERATSVNDVVNKHTENHEVVEPDSENSEGNRHKEAVQCVKHAGFVFVVHHQRP